MENRILEKQICEGKMLPQLEPRLNGQMLAYHIGGSWFNFQVMPKGKMAEEEEQEEEKQRLIIKTIYYKLGIQSTCHDPSGGALSTQDSKHDADASSGSPRTSMHREVLPSDTIYRAKQITNKVSRSRRIQDSTPRSVVPECCALQSRLNPIRIRLTVCQRRAAPVLHKINASSYRKVTDEASGKLLESGQ